MVKAVLNNVILAESTETVSVEGNHYFPPSAVKSEYLTDSNTHTVCGWKGTASYYNAKVDGREVTDIAWYYPETKAAADNIKNYVAFYKSKVQIQ